MPAEIKSLRFFEGVPVTPPTIQPVGVGTAVSASHAMRKDQTEAAIAAASAADIATANAYTDTRIANLIDGAPAALDTLNEIAAAINDDANYAAGIADALAKRVRTDTAAQGLDATSKTNAKTNLDLQNVDNTSDATKNAAVATLTNKTLTAPVINSPTGIVKGDVGLGNVDNTSDATKNAAAVTLTNKTFDKFLLEEVVDSTTAGANATLPAPTKGVVKLTNASLVSIDMIIAVSGLPFMIINKTGNTLLFNRLTGATASRQIETGTGANLSVANNASVWVYYSPTEAKNMIIGGSGSGGGGTASGVALTWKENGSFSPVKSIVDGLDVFEFSQSENQELYAIFKVPESWAGGSLISLAGLSFYSSLNTGNVLFKTEATLISKASGVMGVYTNKRISTNAQVATPASVGAIKDIGAFDLTDTAGLINGVAVLAGDKIRVRIYRDIAAETSGMATEAKLIIDSSEVKF